MMFNETNRVICAYVDITNDFNIMREEGVKNIMITLYTPEREDGQPTGVELRSPELEMFIRDNPTNGKASIYAVPCTFCLPVFQMNLMGNYYYDKNNSASKMYNGTSVSIL